MTRVTGSTPLENEISDPLDDEELAFLDEFLLYRMDVETSDRIAAAGGDEGILDVSELDGFLTAIASGPSPIAPSRWLPAVWGAQQPTWESENQFEEVFEMLIRHQNSIVETLMQAPDQFEPMFNGHEAGGTTHLIADEWCSGYMRGVELDADAWKKNETDIAALLGPIKLWGTEEGVDLVNAMSEADQERERGAIAASARALHKYWLARRTPPPAPVRRVEPKVGRNDPCPCGSGKKYKQCCLQ
jgi:uncharacterized protein